MLFICLLVAVWVLVAVCRLLFSCVAWAHVAVAPLVVEHGLCGTWAQQLQLSGSRGQAQEWHTGLAAPRQVRFSWTRDQTCVFCIGRWILHH